MMTFLRARRRQRNIRNIYPDGPIYSAIDGANYGKADRLIHAAHADILRDTDRELGTPIEEFNALLLTSKFHDTRRRKASRWD